MTNNSAQKTSLSPPTLMLAALGLSVVLLGGGAFVAWLSAPRSVTLEITQPVGKTVVCHLVVDGRAESHEAVAPVTYQFEANELHYAVVCLDGSAPADVTVLLRDQSGTSSGTTSAGIRGSYSANWWGSQSRMEPMTPTHVATMRSSAAAESL